jgi:hypothetical protein
MYVDNITPAGLGNWTDGEIVSATVSGAGKSGEWNTVMPWKMYAGITGQDLSAIYTYLQFLRPIHHEFDRVSSK